MFTKYQMISAIAQETAGQIVKNEEEWTRYLTTAARLYKYPFEEQMLIYAQRPDATACASLETWNEKMNCWVNRGAKGIALIDTESERPRLKYVFDVSDVHKARRIGKDPNLWQLREEHKEVVLKQLEKTYGATDSNAPFESRIMELAERIAFDTYEELLPDIEYVKEGSFLEELDNFNVGVMLRDTLSSSIAYTLLSRCGADMEQWKDELNFEHIHNFNTMKTLSVMGSATTEMCKPVLMEIGRTIGAYERQIARNKAIERVSGEQIDTQQKNIKLGLANESESDYNALKRESEMTDKEKEDVAHDNHIREERGLSDSEHHSERGAEEGTHEVRVDEEELSEGASQGDLQRNDSFGRTESTLSEDTGTGRGENGASDRADGEVRGSERGTESQRPDELGSENEQHQTFSGGDGSERADLQLGVDEELNTEKQESDRDEKLSAPDSFSVQPFTEELRELQRGLLCSDKFLIHKRPEVAGYFQIESNSILQAEYLKNSYRMNEFTLLNIGDVRGGYRADEEGITLWKGEYLTREAECRLSWDEARYWVNSYMEDGTYLMPGEVAERIETDGMFQQMDLFTMFSEQVGNIAMKQIEEPSIMPLGFTLPEKELDTILRTGGGREDSRKRIYAKYQQRKTPQEMEAFLRKEYATTGKGFEIDGKQIAVWFDENGMRVGYGTSATEQPLVKMDWKDIESHIRRQVENGTYMSANEAYLVDAVERERIASHIYFFFRDGIGEMPEELELKLGNYPDSHQKLSDLLATDEGRELIGDLMDNELMAIEMGEKKLRFRSVMPADELREEITNLGISKYTFPLPDSVEVKHEDFITQDEIDNRLGRGSGFAHGAFRIYDYIKAGHDSKETVDFLKHEYGTGGGTHALAGADHSYEDHDAKGIRLRKGNLMDPYVDVLLSWKVVEKRIRKLVNEDKYLSPAGKEAYAKYREEEDRKSLEKAQAKMERNTKVSCKEAIEKAIAEKFDGYRLPKETAEDVIREFGSDRVAYVLANTVMHLQHDGRFSPENKEWAKAIEPYAMIENRDLIVSSHPAVLNGFINQTQRYMEREKELKAQEEAAKSVIPDTEKVTVAIETSDDYAEPEFGFVTSKVTGERYRLVTMDEEGYLIPYIDNHKSFATRELMQEYIDAHADEIDVIGYDDMVYESIHKQAEYKKEQLQEQSIAEELEMTQEEEQPRFQVVETSDAFDVGDDFAIWDNEKEDYHAGKDGTIYTFENKERAGEFLEKVVNETLSNDNAEWSNAEGLVTPFDEPEESKVETTASEPVIDKTGAKNFVITDDALGFGGAKEKFRRNVEAIKTLQTIESENRIATPQEQEILSKYVGWGGLADAFDDSKSNWANEYQELKELLSDTEYAQARESTLNAHYTSPVIIRSIYEALDKMGFEKGNVLEPAMGIGNFFGMLPEKMAESRLYGVELDGITGRIAKQLYPNADVKISGFEKTDYPNDFFDVAIGNVPFGQYKVADKQYDKNNFLIHDYFFGATRS